MSASPRLFCPLPGQRADRFHVRAQRGRTRPRSVWKSRRDSTSTVVAVAALAVKSQVVLGCQQAWSPKWSPSARTPRPFSSPYLPSPSFSTLPWAMRKTVSAGLPASAMTSPGSNSRWTNRSASAVERRAVVEGPEQRQLAQLGGMTRTWEPVLTNVTRPSPTA